MIFDDWQGNNKGVGVHFRPILSPLVEWARNRWIPTVWVPVCLLDIVVAAAAKANTYLTALHVLSLHHDSNNI